MAISFLPEQAPFCPWGSRHPAPQWPVSCLPPHEVRGGVPLTPFAGCPVSHRHTRRTFTEMTGADKSGESTVSWGKWHPVRLACLTGGGAGLPEPSDLPPRLRAARGARGSSSRTPRSRWGRVPVGPGGCVGTRGLGGFRRGGFFMPSSGAGSQVAVGATGEASLWAHGQHLPSVRPWPCLYASGDSAQCVFS